MSNRWDRRAKKFEQAGNKMQKLGCMLTIFLTLPIILGIFLGPIGIGLSILIIVLYVLGKKSEKKDMEDTSKEHKEIYSEYDEEFEKMKAKYDKQMKKYRDQANLNHAGIEYEKADEIDKAIEVYEKNIKDGFDGNHPYDRLAIIYRRRKLYDEEIRVLNRAIEIFEKLESSPRQDVSPKLQRFKDRLEKAKKLKEKHNK